MSLYKRCEHKRDRDALRRCDHPWWYKFALKGEKPIRKSTETADRKIALEIERAARVLAIQKKRGLVSDKVAETAWSVGELVRQYSTYYAQKFPTTFRVYGERVLLSVRDFLGASTPITAVTPFQLTKWRSERARVPQMRKDGRIGRIASRQTAQTEFDVISGMFRTAVVWQKTSGLAVSPAKGVESWEVDEKRVRTASAEELAKLADAPPLVRLLCQLTVTSLGRLAEVALLRPSDLDPVTSRITVRRKGGLAQALPITLDQMTELLALVSDETQAYVLSPLFGKLDTSDPLTLTTRLSERVADWWRSVGVKGVTHHTMRHTGVTLMLEAGVNPRVIQDLAGWKSLDQLQRYGHVRDAEVSKAIAATTAALVAAAPPPAAEVESGRVLTFEAR